MFSIEKLNIIIDNLYKNILKIQTNDKEKLLNELKILIENEKIDFKIDDKELIDQNISEVKFMINEYLQEHNKGDEKNERKIGK